MNTQQDKILGIIAKLMDERDNNDSDYIRAFDELFELVENKLPLQLDKGYYTDNARIIRDVNRILNKNEIFTVIPELAERSLIAIWGQQNNVANEFKAITNNKLGIGYNTNLPLLILPMQGNMENKIYALTYMDKLINLSFEEYKCVTKEIYKEGIDIRKLIKGFVMYYGGNNYNQAYLILPDYFDINNSLYEILSPMITKQLLITDEYDMWEKCVHKIFRLSNQEVYLLGEKEDLDYISDGKKNLVLLFNKEKFKELCINENVPCINFAISVQLQKILMDVDIFYYKKIKELNNKVAKLAKDSINIDTGAIKDQVQYYRKSILAQKETMEKGFESFIKVKEDIIKSAVNYEKIISGLLKHDLAENVNADKYIADLLTVFNKHIYADECEAAKGDLLHLTRANYKYTDACKCLLNQQQGVLQPISIMKLYQYPDTDNEVAKIKIELSDQLDLKPVGLKRLIKNVYPIETGKEYYYLGMNLLDEKKYIQASEAFMKALDNDYDDAGIELIKLAKKHPECNIDIEELAKNLVAEANYDIGCQYINYKYKKGVVNFKMAASKNHIEAIKEIAYILFEKCKLISWQNMQEKNNRHTVNNVIELYTYLYKKEPNQTYKLRIGLMLCKLNEYSRAYDFLKDIDAPEAQYECAKMYQYGNGVAKDLKIAKQHYGKITTNYKDSAIQYKKVCETLEKEKVKKAISGYNENKSYSSSSSYSSYSSSDFCFITTAACIALNENKDCDQLNELRRFRDMYISGDGKDGDDLIEEYYRIGPTIVKYIDSEWNPFAIYDELWLEYILPSCKMIKENKCEPAKRIYIEMVKGLCEKYSVPVKESIMQKYSIKIGE